MVLPEIKLPTSSGLQICRSTIIIIIIIIIINFILIWHK